MPSPSAIRSSPDSDQNLTIEWNLLSGSVRSEPNRCDPISSECITMTKLFLQSAALRPCFANAAEPRGNCFPRLRFQSARRDRIGVARRRRIRRRDQLLPASSVVQRPALSEAVLLANVSHAVGLAAAESRRVVDIFTEFKSWAGRCWHGLRKASPTLEHSLARLSPSFRLIRLIC